jgi:hypothetical protein
MGVARYSQVGRVVRRANVALDHEVADAYRAAATAEIDMGMLIEVQGDKLKMEFKTITKLKTALGPVPTSGTYGLGAKFKLKPPFVILFQPKTGDGLDPVRTRRG